MDSIKPYLKAVVAFVAPAAVSLTSAVQDASAGGSNITSGEWITAICACFITAAAVYAVPNKDPQATHQAESVQPPEPVQYASDSKLDAALHNPQAGE